MKYTLAKGVLLIGTTRFASNIISFVSNIVLARLLTPNDFGLVAIASTFWLLVMSITEFPISSLLLQLDEIRPAHFDTAWTVGFIRALLIVVVTWTLAYPVSVFYRDDRLLPLMGVMGFTTLTGMVRSPRLVEYQKRMRFDVDNKILLAQKLSCALASISIAYWTHSYWAILLATLVSDACGHLLTQWYAPYRPRWSTYELRFFLRQGFWLTVMQIAMTLKGTSDGLIMGYIGNQAMLGRYNVGSNLASLPTRETLTPLSQTLLPSFALIRNDIVRTRIAYQQAQSVLFAVALPAGTGLALLAPFVVKNFLGVQWTGAEVVIQTLSVLYALQTLGTLCVPLAIARGENRTLSLRNIAIFALRAPAITIGILLGGLDGCLVGVCVTGIFDIAITLTIVKRMTGLSLAQQLSTNITTLIATGVMATAASHLPAVFTSSNPSDISYAAITVVIGLASYIAVRVTATVVGSSMSIADATFLQLVRRMARARGTAATATSYKTDE